MERIDLKFQHPKELWGRFVGVKLDDRSYDTLIDGDADVYTPEGELLFKFRKRCLEPKLCVQAFEVLKEIKGKTNNRGMAAGRIYSDRKRAVTNTGYVSKTPRMTEGGQVMSSIIGYFDRYPRIPFCRQTAFNADHPEKFARVLPFIEAVDACYREFSPERYAKQAEVADRTSDDFMIGDTVFTTITVNQNFQTAVHTDQGDLKDGLSCILCLAAGEFTGGILVFPHYRAAVRLDTQDLLLFDSHHMHGNTPIVGRPGTFKRVSLVLYYRERMQDCGTAAQELDRAKNRKPGGTMRGKPS